MSINAATGNLVIAKADEFLAGRGPDASVARTYNSLANGQNDDNGDGWRQSTDRRIKGYTGTSVTRVSADGTEITYTGGNGVFTTTEGAGAYDTLTYSNNVWTFTDGDTQVREEYEANGNNGWRIRSETDTNGVSLTYSYVDGNRLSRVTTSAGEYIAYQWTGSNITRIDTGYIPTGIEGGAQQVFTRTRYEYDANRLSAVVVDLTPENGSDSKTYRTDYTYDGGSTRVKTITQSDGSRLEFDYTGNRVTAYRQTVAGTAGQSPTTRQTTILYDQPSDTAGRTVTKVTDDFGQVTALEYETATGRLMKLTAPAADGGTASQVLRYEYNGNGDVTKVTDATGAFGSYTYTASGMVQRETLRTGDTIDRTYDAKNRLLTQTRYGSQADDGNAPQTQRFVYDAEGNLRFAVDAAGGVTDYRYNQYGLQNARYTYTDGVYGGDGTLADLTTWAGQRDAATTEVTTMTYDLRGNLRTTVSGAAVTATEGPTASSKPIANGANTAVTLQPSGLYRVEKTGGSADWNADARSAEAMDGDFVVQVRPAQNNRLFMAGVSTNPSANSGWSALSYAFYANENGQLMVTENGYPGIALNAGYAPGDNLWIARSGSVVGYFKGATYEAALAAGALRYVDGAYGTYYFDSSILNVGAAFEAGIYQGTPVPVSSTIVNGANTSLDLLQNGGYRITKTDGTNAAWDADARGTRAFDGNFALGIRPTSNNKILMAGVSRSPGGSSSYTDLAYSLYFQTNGQLNVMESGGQSGAGSYAAGEQFWIVRSGTTLSYYRGNTFEAAVAAGAFRTMGNATGTFYFDSSLYQSGAAVEVVMAPATPQPSSVALQPGNYTSIARQGTGLWRMTKTGGSGFGWDADARSQTSLSGDFVFQVKPIQSDKFMMVGLSTTPFNSGSHSDLDYALYFQSAGNVFAWENRGAAYGLNTDYNAGDSFWITRAGSTISYFKGATFEQARLAGAIRTVNNASTAAMWVDSSIAQIGAAADVAFTQGQPSRTIVPVDAGTNTSYYPLGNGTYQISKTGGQNVTWDADARSSQAMSGDFALQLRPTQGDKLMMLGLSRNPGNSASYGDLDYAFYFLNDGGLLTWEGGGATINGAGRYSAYQNFWIFRDGSTLSYGVGVDLATARQNTIRVVYGVSGDLYFDSTLYQSGAGAQIGFTRAGAAPTTTAVVDKTTGIATASTTVAPGAAGSKTTYVYDTAGQLLSRVTDTLNAETFAYDGLGRLTASTDRNGGTTSIVFDDAAMTTKVTLASGLVTASTYNRAGELVSTMESGADTTTGQTLNTYDGLGRLRTVTDATGRSRHFLYDSAGRKVADIGHDGELTEYRYDAADRIVATIRYEKPVSAADMTRVRNAATRVTLASVLPPEGLDLRSWRIYDTGGRLIETIDGDGSTTRFDYDASDRLVRTTGFANKLGANSLVALRTQPPTTLQLPVSDGAHDIVSRSFYDQAGRLVGTLDGAGYVVRHTYDAAGRKTQTTAYANAATANRSTATLDALTAGLASANDRTSRLVYDRQGLLRFEVDPIGRVVEYTYDTAAASSETGQVRQTIRYAGSIAALSSYTLASVRTALATLAGNAENRRSFTVYDAAGRVAYAIDASGLVTGFTYDNSGRVTKSVRYAQARTTTTLPTLADMDGWRSTNAGNVGNRTTWNFYTARGELRYTAEATGLIDAEGAYLTRFDYDAEGRLTATRRQDGAVSLAALANGTSGIDFGPGRTTRTEYDMLGRVQSTFDGENIETRYAYRANGTLASTTRAYGTADASRTSYVADATGRVASTTDADGTGAAQTSSVVYDGVGNVIEATDASGNKSYRTYDAAGRLTSQKNALLEETSYTYNAFDDLVSTTDATRVATSWNFYDNAGRLTVARDAENYLTETTYTVFGEVETVTRRYNRATNSGGAAPVVASHARDATTRFAYDRRGRVTSTTDAESRTERYDLNAFGDRIKVTGKNNLVTDYTYDRRGLLVSQKANVSAVSGTGTVAYIVTDYGYDARGNRTRLTEASNTADSRVTDYVYDQADRLVETKRTVALGGTATAVASEKLTYDKRGNVIKRTDATDAATFSWYDALDRVVATVDAVGALVRSSYAIDTGGGSRRIDVAHGVRVDPASLTAGSATPPAVAANEQDRTTRTEFDKLGRVASVSIAGAVTGRWTGNAVATTTGDLTTAYTYDAAGNLVSTSAPDRGTSYAYYDRLGRQTAAIDALGYLTTWARNGDGNVETEVRYATATSGASATYQPAATVDAANDRTTGFTYDKLGQRTSETRRNVAYTIVDAATGDPTAVTGDATIAYEYNALGQVRKKTEATGDVTVYDYDAAGRLTRESRPTFASTAAGGTATPTLDYSYDGLGNLVKTRQGNAVVNADTDRTTTYRYGAGGRLLSTTDATDATRSFGYDKAGRKTWEQYDRLLAIGGSTVTEAIGYTYDAVGRVVRTGLYAVDANGNRTAQGEHSRVTYNAFGDVYQRFVIGTGGAPDGKLQETNDYDSAGRLWRSNAGDGVQRYFVSDAAGNRTLTIESAGADIAGKTLQQAIDAANADPAGIVRTVAQYDARGQLTATRQLQRQLVAGGTLQDLVSSRTSNAFGETVTETDARNAVTTYGYNTMGRVTQVTRPHVTTTDAAGNAQSTPTIESAGYDQSGRLVTSTDANGYVTRRTLLAGTGYGGGSEAMVTREWRTDNGSTRMDYDQFGDLRTSSLLVGTDANGNEVRRTTTNVYDKAGRLTRSANARGLVDSYAYDQLGQRLRHTNSLLGTGDAETTRYDTQGRVVATRSFGGDETAVAYTWSDTVAASGLGLATGGIVRTTTYANTRTASETTDGFGHVVSSQNMGGAVTATTYDKGGRITDRRTSLNGTVTDTLAYTYLNTGLAASATRTGEGHTTLATYGYDETGRKRTETTSVDGTLWQNATATYDLAGRMTRWTEAGNGGTVAAAAQDWTYDKAGNIRSVTRDGATRWYKYDKMNRVLVDGGTVQNGQIVRGTTGIAISYDAAGERATVTSYYGGTYQRENPADEGRPITEGFDGEQRETYGYNADGTLASVNIAHSSAQAFGSNPPVVTGSSGLGALRSTITTDVMGRFVRQQDLSEGGGVVYDRRLGNGNGNDQRDGNGQVWKETIVQRRGTDTVTTYNSYSYGTRGTLGYALGQVTGVGATVATLRSGGQVTTDSTGTAYGYAWYDGPTQSGVSTSTNDGTAATTTYGFTGTGTLTGATVTGYNARTVAIVNDVLGQAIRRTEGGTSPMTESWYRFDGRQIGTAGTSTTDRANWDATIAQRGSATGSSRVGSGGDWSGSYEAYNSYAQGSAQGSYTVRAGDTLAGIAASLWGDAGLWYKIASANGLSGADASLTAGTILQLPANVVRTTNSAATFRPYDPTDAYGDTSPTTPTPQGAGKKNKCGVFGQILLVAVAVAVTVVSSGAALAALSSSVGTIGSGIATVLGTSAAVTTGVSAGALVAAGAIGAAVGSAVSQGIGVATGIQQQFSWKGVALAAIGGAVGGGLGAAGVGGAGIAGAALRGALGSAITQGIGIATKLQSKFDFVGVAAAGVVGGVGRAIAPQGASFGRQLLAGAASGLAGAATRSAISGTSFGDNILAVLPDVIGTTVGRLAARALAGKSGTTVNAAVPAQQTADAAPSSGGGPLSALAQVVFSPEFQQAVNSLPRMVQVPDTTTGQMIWVVDDNGVAPETGPFKVWKNNDDHSAGVRDGTDDDRVGSRPVPTPTPTPTIDNSSGSSGGGVWGWISSLFSGLSSPTSRLNAAFAGQFGWDAHVRARMEGADSEQASAAGREGISHAISYGVGNLALGQWEATAAFTSAALAPPLIFATEQSSSPYIVSGGRNGAISSPWWGVAASAVFGKAAAPLAAGSKLPTIAFSKADTPGIANNIEAALAEGHPSVLNRLVGRDAIRAQRADALAGQARPPSGYSLDEFPFASSQQGGAGARIAQVPVAEQNIQGGMLSSFYQQHGITHGDPFRVLVVP